MQLMNRNGSPAAVDLSSLEIILSVNRKKADPQLRKQPELNDPEESHSGNRVTQFIKYIYQMLHFVKLIVA